MMSLKSKEALGKLLAVITAGLTGWLVKVAYDKGDFFLPAVLLVIFVVAQLLLAFVSSKEEEEIKALRAQIEGMRYEREIWHRLEVSKVALALAASEQTLEQIRAGNLEGAKEWRKLL